MVEIDLQILTSEQREQLQTGYLWGRFHDRPATVSDKGLEPDGRRRNRVVKECINAGLLVPSEESAWHGKMYEITSEVIRAVVPEPPNLFETWTTLQAANPHREAYERPWIRVEPLPIEAQCALLNESSGIDWFVVSRTPYEYHAEFADEPQTTLADVSRPQAFNRYWAGPFATLAEATSHQKQSPGTCLAVSSAELRTNVNVESSERKLQWKFANNLLWGLVALQLVPKDAIFDVEGKPTLDSQLVEGHSLRLSSDPNPPQNREAVHWEANLAQSIERLKARISKAEQQLNTLRRIDSQVEMFGGWAPFMDAFEARLRNEYA